MNVSDDNTINIAFEEEVCAHCGKEGIDLKACTACKLVKYCNRECQIAHRSQHKKECRRRANKIHDVKLFKQPPLREDCPICFLRLPTLVTGWRYQSCCGKVICSGCVHAPVYDNQGNEVDNEKCPFCRTPFAASDEEMIERIKKRVEAGDAQAIFSLGCYYRDGTYGFTQDIDKALEHWHRAGEIGCAAAHGSIGSAYCKGEGVEVDKKKAKHHDEVAAAMAGGEIARHNLGNMEVLAGNFDRALKHYMIVIRSVHAESLKTIKILYSNGHATKDDYTKALQSYQAYLGEIKSAQRDKAAAANEMYRYY